MNAIADFLNRLSPVEAGILTVLFLALSYFFLRRGQQTSTPHPRCEFRVTGHASAIPDARRESGPLSRRSCDVAPNASS